MMSNLHWRSPLDEVYKQSASVINRRRRGTFPVSLSKKGNYSFGGWLHSCRGHRKKCLRMDHRPGTATDAACAAMYRPKASLRVQECEKARAAGKCCWWGSAHSGTSIPATTFAQTGAAAMAPTQRDQNWCGRPHRHTRQFGSLAGQKCINTAACRLFTRNVFPCPVLACSTYPFTLTRTSLWQMASGIWLLFN